MPPPLPEVWLRGPVAGFPPELMPVAHSLLQVLEEVDGAIRGLSVEELRARPGGAASVAFHVKHLAGSLDRLLTYARGESLSDAQLATLSGEECVGANDQPAMMLRAAYETVERALEQVRTTPVAMLNEPRSVGRAGLPSTVRGLLFHAAEHAQRHAGQIVTTARIVCGSRGRV